MMKRVSLPEDPWVALVDRFADFAKQPCLRGSGPYTDHTKAEALGKKVRAQLDEAWDKNLLPPTPNQLTQQHVSEMLKSMKKAGRGPSHRALWKGLWRAIIFERDDYTCHFCHRSGEAGITIPGFGCLALRLQLDHIQPRADGGADFELSNMRTACRVCNHGRFKLSDEHFRAEMLSLARSVWLRYGGGVENVANVLPRPRSIRADSGGRPRT